VSLIDKLWYKQSAFSYLLLPLTAVFFLLSLFRRVFYRLGLKKIGRLDVPVIVVGNITVGGTGKTPLVVWIADYLKVKGYRPGLISRGYGGKAKNWPQQVRPDSDPKAVGDEAILLSRRTGCPMAVGPDRYKAGKALLENSDCNILISDDGLQHYGLGRDVEIAVIDGRRRFGNGFLLPAGPLREGEWRLNFVDLVVSNGPTTFKECSMKTRLGELVSLGDQNSRPLKDFARQKVHAVAGIGNNERFFKLLKDNELQIIEHSFDDHHVFTRQDIDFNDDLPVIMTEKDAVKCQYLTDERYWYLQVSAQPEAKFVQAFFEIIEGMRDGQETA
jgi:tetraacyldisaccharide 4'-kinase